MRAVEAAWDAARCLRAKTWIRPLQPARPPIARIRRRHSPRNLPSTWTPQNRREQPEPSRRLRVTASPKPLIVDPALAAGRLSDECRELVLVLPELVQQRAERNARPDESDEDHLRRDVG